MTEAELLDYFDEHVFYELLMLKRRLDATISATETRLGAKVDKLSDQFTAMDERTSRIEGERATKAEKGGR